MWTCSQSHGKQQCRRRVRRVLACPDVRSRRFAWQCNSAVAADTEYFGPETGRSPLNSFKVCQVPCGKPWRQVLLLLLGTWMALCGGSLYAFSRPKTWRHGSVCQHVQDFNWMRNTQCRQIWKNIASSLRKLFGELSDVYISPPIAWQVSCGIARFWGKQGGWEASETRFLLLPGSRFRS